MKKSPKPKKSKRSAKKKAKDKAWNMLSRYKRLLAADHNGYVKCSTCNTVKHWKEMQAGHFVPQAQGDAARFCEDNVHPQCYRCNINLGGNGAEYTPFMVEKYGPERVEEIRKLAGVVVKFNQEDYEGMSNKYSELVEILEQEKG